MKKMLTALVAAGGLLLVPASAQAAPHPEVSANSPAACHGMVVKLFSTSGYSPGQLKQLFPTLDVGWLHKELREACAETGHLPPGQAK